MSINKSIITCSFLPTLHTHSSCNSKTRISLFCSSNVATANNLFLAHTPAIRVRRQNCARGERRLYICNAVGPGPGTPPQPPPPPPGPPFNFLCWIMGVAAWILPFFSHRWTSLLKIKNEVETAVHVADDIVEVVGKVADTVEKVAEDIAADLPEGGRLRQAVEFVEHAAHRASDDAHSVDDFIHKVEEVEEKVEKSVEYWAEEASKNDPPIEEEITDVTDK